MKGADKRCAIVAICLGAVLIAFSAWKPITFHDSLVPQNNTSPADLQDQDNCWCRSPNGSMDFCYRFHDVNSGNVSVGQRFSCEWLPVIARLGLLRNEFVPQGVREFKEPVVVTAFSGGHVDMGLRLIATVQQHLPGRKIIVFDLGNIDVEDQKKIMLYCDVEYRQFNYSAFPSGVRALREYRWKPLIIAEVLMEYEALWYLDTSVILRTGNVSLLYRMLTQPKHSAQYGRSVVQQFHKFPYILHSRTSHSIFAATHPDVYNYFPTDIEKLKASSSEMLEAGFALVVRVKEVVQNVLIWYVLCALEQQCMAPTGSQLGCFFGADRFVTYPGYGCHRFDQSVLNVLLATENQFDGLRYYSGFTSTGFEIVRGALGSHFPRICAKDKATRSPA